MKNTKAPTLRNCFQENSTVVANDFIDNYMARANGEYVKVYLLLLRHARDPEFSLSVSALADCLDCTEKDILRALGYWAKAGMLRVEYDESGDVSCITIGRGDEGGSSRESASSHGAAASSHLTAASSHPTASSSVAEGRSSDMGTRAPSEDIPRADAVSGDACDRGRTGTVENIACDLARSSDITGKSSDSGEADRITSGGNAHGENRGGRALKSDEHSTDEEADLQQLYFVTEQYLGRPLSVTDIQKLNYFYDDLDFSTDLIEYLIEYCVDHNHKTMRYIESVANSWADRGVTTVDEARAQNSSYSKTYFGVLREFGIAGRNPAPGEAEYIKRWSEEYGFSDEIIQAACKRAILKPGNSPYPYTDSILKNWLEKGVKNLDDVSKLDEAHEQQKAKRPSSAKRPSARGANRFNNFEGRPGDESSIERQLLAAQHKRYVSLGLAEEDS